MSRIPELVALVPMRHNSERVPGKNYRLLGGQPLYRHIVASLTKCPEVEEIAVDTDSEVIMEDLATAFPEVSIVRRPSHLTDGSLPMTRVLENTVKTIPAKLYLQTHSTNPFLRWDTISDAINRFRTAEEYDSLFSVSRIQSRLWDERAQPMNHEIGKLLRTQDLNPVFEENSCLYLFTSDVLQGTGNRIGRTPMMFETDPLESWDIDTEADFLLAECIHDYFQRKG